MHEFAAEVSADRTKATLTWTQQKMELDANRLQELIGLLGHLRAHMQPAIPNKDLKPGDRASMVSGLRWFLTTDPAAPTCIRLWLLHPGFGWMFLPLGEDGASALHAAIPEVLARRPTVS